MSKVELDFDNVPLLEGGIPILLKFDQNYDITLTKFPKVLERAWSSLEFSVNINESNKGESLLRASLSEFVSIEESLKIDNPKMYKNSKINQSTSPLLRMMKELRNYDMHIGTNSVSSINLEVGFVGRDEEIENVKTYNFDFPIISNLTVDEFKKLDCYKKYSLYSIEEITKMVSYFEEAQRAFGVSYLIRKGVNHYLYEIQSKM